MLEKNYDVVVAGGGISGVCAALASARRGRKTALIQNRPVLGGNSSSEIRVWTRGAVGGGSIYGEEMGILGELKLYNLRRNPDGNPVLWDEILLDRLISQENLDLYLNTHVYRALCDERGNVAFLLAAVLESEEEYCFTGKMVIDATGDGAVAAQAGLPYRVGREEKTQYGESLGVEKEDSHVLGSSLFFQTKRGDKPVTFIKPDYAYDIAKIEALLEKGGGRIVNEQMNGCDYWWMEFGGEYDTILEGREIYLELKRLSMGIWNYIKNSGKFEAQNLTLEWIGNIAGKRESRRFAGEYTLTQRDIEEGKRFEDAIAYGGWYMDFHPSGGIYSEEEFCRQIPVFAYDIPLRCLYNKLCGNLFLAGRNISVSHAAFSSTRIMDTCGLVGQAAGEAAALCAEKEISTKALNRTEWIHEIRQRLLKEDGGILGGKNTDPQDKARQAAVMESGHREIKKEKADGYVLIEQGSFLICPDAREAEKIGFSIRCRENTQLTYRICRSSLPNRFLDGELEDGGTVEVKKGQEELFLPLKNANSGFAKIVFEENDALELAVTEKSLTGFLTGKEDSPRYLTPCITAYGDIYACKAVVNGYQRPYQGTNLWISGNLKQEQYLKFVWEKPTTIRQIRICFQPGLDKELPSSVTCSLNPHHGFAGREGEAKELVKDFDVCVMEGQKEKTVAEVRDNYLRLCIVDIREIKTTELKLVFKETYGAEFAEVFEVRIY